MEFHWWHQNRAHWFIAAKAKKASMEIVLSDLLTIFCLCSDGLISAMKQKCQMLNLLCSAKWCIKAPIDNRKWILFKLHCCQLEQRKLTFLFDSECGLYHLLGVEFTHNSTIADWHFNMQIFQCQKGTIVYKGIFPFFKYKISLQRVHCWMWTKHCKQRISNV